MSHTSVSASLSASAEALLRAAHTTVVMMADWIVEAFLDMRRRNNPRASVYAEWQEWGGGSAAVEVYRDGPDADACSAWAQALRNAEIQDAVAAEIDARMAPIVQHAVKIAVREADDLDELMKALNEAADYASDEGVDVTSLYNSTMLPVFGDRDVPGGRAGVFSWDEKRFLVQGDNGGWALIPRDDDGR